MKFCCVVIAVGRFVSNGDVGGVVLVESLAFLVGESCEIFSLCMVSLGVCVSVIGGEAEVGDGAIDEELASVSAGPTTCRSALVATTNQGLEEIGG